MSYNERPLAKNQYGELIDEHVDERSDVRLAAGTSVLVQEVEHAAGLPTQAASYLVRTTGRRVRVPAGNVRPAHVPGRPMVGREFVVHETVEEVERTCNLGHTHRRSKTLLRYTLVVVMERRVRNTWLAAYGQDGDGVGLLAIDQFGTTWTRDWAGVSGDGPSAYWHSDDGRVAQQALLGGKPAGVHDGWVLEAHDGQVSSG